MKRLTIEGLTRLPSRPHLPAQAGLPAGGRRPGVGPSCLRLIRLQVKPRRFWREFQDDRQYIVLKVALLAALVVLAALL